MVVGLLVLSACGSSGASPGTDGTHTSPSSTASAAVSSRRSHVRRFFAGAGSELVGFERATVDLMTGIPPSRTACNRALEDLQPLTSNGRRFSELLRRIPDARLRDALRRDAQNKVFLLRACVSPTGLRDTPDQRRTFELYRQQSDVVRSLLTRAGVDL